MITKVFLLYFLFIFNSLAQPYLNSEIRKTIGKIESIKGNVVLYQNQNILLQYAKKNTLITNNIFIKTRRNSKAVIKFNKGEKLTLGQNSRVYLSFANRYGRISVKLMQGRVLVQDEGIDKKNIIASVKDSKFAYSGKHLALTFIKNKERVFTSKGNKVYKYSLSGKEKTIFKEADLNRLLHKKINENKDIYTLRKEMPKMNRADSLKDTPIIDTDTTNIDDEINNLFDDNNELTAVKSDSDIANEIESVFGETIETTEQKPNQVYIDDDPEKFKIDVDYMIRTSVFTQSPAEGNDVDDSPVAIETRLGLGNKTIIGSQSSVTTSGWLEVGSRKKTYSSLRDLHDYRKEKRGYITLNEAYYQLTSKNSDFTIGKKVYRTGKGMIYSPSDKITPKDTLIPTDPLFLGNYMVNYDLYINKFDFSFVLQPFFKPNRVPPPFNRFTVIPQGANFNIRNEYPDGFAWKNMQSFFKVETTFNGWDLSLGVYNGPNTEPIIRNDIDNSSGEPNFTLVQEFIPITNINFGFSTTFQSLEIHGEILKQNASEGRDDSFTTYMVGGFYTIDRWCKNFGIDQIRIILEFTNEEIHKKQSYPFYVTGSSTSRIFQRGYLGSFNFQINDKTSLNYDFHNDARRDGLVQAFSTSYVFENKGNIRLRYESFSGTGESIYATWQNNDNVSLEYRYNF